jgi:hypothetical protein
VWATAVHQASSPEAAAIHVHEDVSVEVPKAARGLLASLARLLARRGAACGHLRRYGDAARDFDAGSDAMRLAGLPDKAGELLQDAARMRDLQAQAEKTSLQGHHRGSAYCSTASVDAAETVSC